MKNHPEDEAPPSLSLGVSRCRSPLSGSDLSSTSTKERFVKEDDYNYMIVCKQRSAFTGEKERQRGKE
ncbi:hypothetical protein YC2023_055958 [Brassica napus]